MTEAQKKKQRFRQSKKWRDLRHKKNVEQSGKDPITLKKLYKGANLHHLDLDENHYQDISDETHFVLLNKECHETLHILFKYYRKDPEILERFKIYLNLMVYLNGAN